MMDVIFGEIQKVVGRDGGGSGGCFGGARRIFFHVHIVTHGSESRG